MEVNTSVPELQFEKVRVCETCKKEFNSYAKKKYCPECAKARRLESARLFEERKRKGEKGPRSGVAKEKQVREILQGRGLPEYFIGPILAYGFETAEINDEKANIPYWTGEDETASDYPAGELHPRSALKALYHYVARGRQILGQVRTFEEWLGLRDKTKRDLWFLAKEVCGKGLTEKPHRELIDFFVKKDPTLLPPDYDQEQLKNALLHQREKHSGLCLFPRGNYKSTCDCLDVVQWLITFPDVRVLVVTSTHPLSRTFVGEIRSYFIRSIDRPTNLNLLFPEFTITATEGSELLFKSPATRLKLKEPSVWSSAIDADSVGFHPHVLIFDDAVSDDNSQTPEARDKLESRFNIICELLVVPHGFLQVFGTRYAGGANPDLYGRLITRQDPGMEILVRSAWTVKEYALAKNIHDLVEEDVELLWPVGPDGQSCPGAFKVLKRKLKASEKTFRQQQLNEGISDEDEGLILNFDIDVLRSRVLPLNAVPQAGESVMSVDVAFSQNKYADFSSIALTRLYTKADSRRAVCVVDMDYGRMRLSELAQKIVELTLKYRPSVVIIEKIATWEVLQTSINDIRRKYGNVVVPIYWAPVSNSKGAKNIRIKALEALVESGQLTFAPGEWVEGLFGQLIKLSGPMSITTRNSRKDDLPDSISMATSVRWAKDLNIDEKKSEEAKKLEEMMLQQAARVAFHDMLFGVGMPYKPPVTPESMTPVDTRRAPLIQQGHRLLGPGFRI